MKSLSFLLTELNFNRINEFSISYGRYLEGTGSLLKVQGVREDLESADETKMLKVQNSSIRYFSPKEIANLHCFPKDFGIFSNYLLT